MRFNSAADENRIVAVVIVVGDRDIITVAVHRECASRSRCIIY